MSTNPAKPATIITPREVRTEPADLRAMSQVGREGACWFKPVFGHPHAVKVFESSVLFVHNVTWRSRGHVGGEEPCGSPFELSGMMMVVLPIRAEPSMLTVAVNCPRCSDALCEEDLIVEVEYIRVTKKTLLDGLNFHDAPANPQ